MQYSGIHILLEWQIQSTEHQMLTVYSMPILARLHCGESMGFIAIVKM